MNITVHQFAILSITKKQVKRFTRIVMLIPRSVNKNHLLNENSGIYAHKSSSIATTGRNNPACKVPGLSLASFSSDSQGDKFHNIVNGNFT